jgi:SAM-dependent methyltransferase
MVPSPAEPDSPLSKAYEAGLYEYHARNWRHGFRHLPPSSFEHVLCVCGAFADELQPLAGRAQKVTVLNSSRGASNPKFEYLQSDPGGWMPFANRSFDLVTCFGALHQFSDFAVVVKEMVRCTKPSGWVLICEPSHSMASRNGIRRARVRWERGIPYLVMRKLILDSGLQIVRERRCMFSLTPTIKYLLPRRLHVYNTPWIAALDDLLCNLPIWSQRYHARNFLQRIRPLAAFFVLQRPP